MGKAVGLEIHARGVRAVEVSGRGAKSRITRYLERDLTPRGGQPDPEELQAALEEIFKSGKFARNNVVGSFEANETVVREIPVPFKADDQIRKVIKYEAEHHLHNCDADDVVVQYTRVGEAAEGTNLLVFAARKDALSRRIEQGRAAGVEFLAVDLDAVSFLDAARAAGLFKEQPNCVLANISNRSTDLIFVVDGEMRALRSVRMGVDSISQGLARDMDIDDAEASSKLAEISAEEEADGDLLLPVSRSSESRPETEKSHAELERDLFVQKRDEFVARLKREYVRSSAALRGSSAPQVMYVSGPGLKVPGLLDMVSERIGVPLEAFRPSQSFDCKLNGTEPADFDAGAAVAVGLALKGIGYDPLGLDFRQEELKVANKFELLKNTLAVTVTLLFVALMATAFSLVYKKNTISRELYDPMVTNAYMSFLEVSQKYNALGEQLVPEREQVDAQYVERNGERYLAINRFVSKLRNMRGRLQRIVGDDKGLPQINSALKTWDKMFKVIGDLHEEIDYIDFEKIEIRQKSITMMIVVPSAAAAERLEAPLTKLFPDYDLEGYYTTPVTGTELVRARLAWKPSKKRKRTSSNRREVK